METHKPTAGIVLAAGMSKRFGSPKLLARLGDGKTVLEWTVKACLASKLEHIFLILGHRSNDILTIIQQWRDPRRLSISINPDFTNGQSTSLCKGIEQVRGVFPSAMFILGDQPLISATVLDDLLERFWASKKNMCVPVYEHQRGNPVIFSHQYYEEISALKGDTGARRIIEKYPDQVLKVPVGSASFFQDVDTREDLAMMKSRLTVLVKGAGEIATGVAWRLHRSGFQVVMTEVDKPLAVRRAVSFCEAVYEGCMTVEGVEAKLIKNPRKAVDAWANSHIPLLVDPQMKTLMQLEPDVLVEATLSKKNTGISIHDAPWVIALGPGYKAGQDAHLVIETNRGHHLGRLYTTGYAQANTGVPGNISGFTSDRVLRAPAAGNFEATVVLGDRVDAGQVVATVAGEPVEAHIPGIVRGLIRSHTRVKAGFKVGDIDPRGDESYLHTISEKARAIGGSVLEGILRKYNT